MSTIIQYLVIVTWKYLQIIIVGHVCSCIEQPVPLLLHEGQVLLLHEMCHCMVARCSLWGCHWSFTSCWTRGIAVAWGCYMSCITVAWGVSCCKRGIAVAAVAWGVLLLQLLHEGSGQGVIAVAWGCYMSGSTVAWGLSLDVLLHEGCAVAWGVSLLHVAYTSKILSVLDIDWYMCSEEDMGTMESSVPWMSNTGNKIVCKQSSKASRAIIMAFTHENLIHPW